jgi:hypothetical protein
VREKTKTVYYCDHCGKHGLRRNAMEAHEARCVRNPERRCRWGGPHQPDIAPLVQAIRDRAPLDHPDIEWLRNELSHSDDLDAACPACMLAVLLQSGVEYRLDPSFDILWSYDAEVAAYREAERSHDALDQEGYGGY